jgi:hypothetical protein
LERVDISDIRNQPVAHAFYTHAVAIEKRDGMTTVEFTGTRRWIIFLAPKRITFYVDPKPNEHDDQV